MLLGEVFGVNDARARRTDARLKQQPQEWTDKVRVSGCYYRQVDPDLLSRGRGEGHYCYCGVGKVTLA